MTRITHYLSLCLLLLATPVAAQVHISIDGPYGVAAPGLQSVCGFAADAGSVANITNVTMQVDLLQIIYNGQTHTWYTQWMPIGVYQAVRGVARPDVANAFGQTYLNSGWCATLDLGPGTYLLHATAYLAVAGPAGATQATSAWLSVRPQMTATMNLQTAAVLPQSFSVTGTVTDAYGADLISAACYAYDKAKLDTGYRWFGWMTLSNGAQVAGPTGPWSCSGTLSPGDYDFVAEFIVYRPDQERYVVLRMAQQVKVQ